MLLDQVLVAAVAAAASAPTAAATAKSAATFRLRTGFIDVHGAAFEFPAIQFRDGAVGFSIVIHFDKSEPSRLACIAVGDDIDAIDGAIRFK